MVVQLGVKFRQHNKLSQLPAEDKEESRLLVMLFFKHWILLLGRVVKEEMQGFYKDFLVAVLVVMYLAKYWGPEAVLKMRFKLSEI